MKRRCSLSAPPASSAKSALLSAAGSQSSPPPAWPSIHAKSCPGSQAASPHPLLPLRRLAKNHGVKSMPCGGYPTGPSKPAPAASSPASANTHTHSPMRSGTSPPAAPTGPDAAPDNPPAHSKTGRHNPDHPPFPTAPACSMPKHSNAIQRNSTSAASTRFTDA